MKFETVIKSLMIAGLLAGATEANAVKHPSANCQILIVKNDSRKNQNNDRDSDYTAQPIFKSCGSPNAWNHGLVKPGETKKYCIEPGSTLSIDKGVVSDPYARKGNIESDV